MKRTLSVALAVLVLLGGCCIARNAPAAIIEESAATTAKPAEMPATTLTDVTEPAKEPAPTPPAVAEAKDFIEAFTAAKLPLGKVVEYTKETDPNKKLGKPDQYIQKINWGDSRVADSDVYLDAGTIEVFSTPEAAKARFDYVEGISKSAPILGTYNYVIGRYHMRLSLKLRPEQLEKYEAVFNNLAK